MKKTLKIMLVLMLAVLMLSSSVTAYAAKPASTEVVELNWEDFQDALKESKLEGTTYTLNAVAAEFWVTDALQPYDVDDEDAENGMIAFFSDEEGDYGFFVTYFDGEGATLEDYADMVAEDKAYTNLEYVCVNGLDAIAYSESDKEMGMDYEYVTFITDGGYVLTFTYWDTADENYMNMVTIMIASIRPEEEETK